MKKEKPRKPVIIDYPEDREALKREFGKMAADPALARSVAMALKVICKTDDSKIIIDYPTDRKTLKDQFGSGVVIPMFIRRLTNEHSCPKVCETVNDSQSQDQQQVGN